MAVDPVCGMSVDEARAAGATEYRGKRYYFCSKFIAEKAGGAFTITKIEPAQ